MKKKDFPIHVLEDLQKLKLNLSTDVRIESAKDTLLHFVDKDPYSDFYFSITGYRYELGKFLYTIKIKPASRIKIESKTVSLPYDAVIKVLHNWQELISTYNSQEFFAENSRLNKYAKEFFEDYKILDEDADSNSFDLPRQLLLDEYLDKSIIFIKEFETENKIDLSSLIDSATEIKNTQTQLTKNETIRLLSKFWAISRDKGLPLLKKLLFEFGKELLFEYGKKLISLY